LSSGHTFLPCKKEVDGGDFFAQYILRERIKIFIVLTPAKKYNRLPLYKPKQAKGMT